VQCLGNQVDSSRINSVWSETVSSVLIFWVLLLKTFSNVLLSSTISMWKMTKLLVDFVSVLFVALNQPTNST
jgi:hypothetical protein